MHWRIKTPVVTFDISEIETFSKVSTAGIDGIPHITFKTFHKAAGVFKWWGVHIRQVREVSWQQVEVDYLKKRMISFVAGRSGGNLCSDLDRIVENIIDVTTGRKRPVIYGGDQNDVLQTQLINGVQIDVTQHRDPTVESYGGYLGKITLFGNELYGFVYHRGVMLYNHLNEHEAVSVVQSLLPVKFPIVFSGEGPKFEIIARLERRRNKVGNFKRRNAAAAVN